MMPKYMGCPEEMDNYVSVSFRKSWTTDSTEMLKSLQQMSG